MPPVTSGQPLAPGRKNAASSTISLSFLNGRLMPFNPVKRIFIPSRRLEYFEETTPQAQESIPFPKPYGILFPSLRASAPKNIADSTYS